jgi:hypothetical protein
LLLRKDLLAVIMICLVSASRLFMVSFLSNLIWMLVATASSWLLVAQ